MSGSESDIDDFAFIMVATAPIWIPIAIIYEFIEKIQDILIWCAWGGVMFCGLLLGAITAYLIKDGNIALSLFALISHPLILVLNFMQETSSCQNLWTALKIFIETAVVLLALLLLNKYEPTYKGKKKKLKPVVTFIILLAPTLLFFQYSYDTRLRSIQDTYADTPEITLPTKPEYRNSINLNLDRHQVDDSQFIPFGKQLRTGEKVHLTDETITDNGQTYALVFNERGYNYVKISNGEGYLKEYASFYETE